MVAVVLFMMVVGLLLLVSRWSLSLGHKDAEGTVEYVSLDSIANADLRASGQAQQRVRIATTTDQTVRKQQEVQEWENATTNHNLHTRRTSKVSS